MSTHHFFLVKNPVASFWLGLSGDYVSRIELFEENSQLAQKALIQHFETAQFHLQLPAEINQLIERIWRFDQTILIQPQGTPWQQEVWQAACQIPLATTVSYEKLAQWAGRPKACRAVANALHANPIPIIIPCHRIIRKNNALGGFGGGIAMKQRLLAFERTLK